MRGVRGVREAPEVQSAADAALEKWARAEEAWEAVKWVLARDTTIGEPISEGGRARSFSYEGAVSLDMPDIVVLYEFDEQFVTILSVRFAASKSRQAGRA